MNKKNHIMTMVGIIIIIAGGMFYGGMKYGTAKAASDRLAQRGGNPSGMNIGAAGAGRGQRGPGAAGQAGGNPGDVSAGDVIAKDDKSVTIKTRDGGSKIVYFSDATTVGKAVDGAVSDLSIGASVMISGKANADGSLAAQNIQIRPTQAPGQNR